MPGHGGGPGGRGGHGGGPGGRGGMGGPGGRGGMGGPGGHHGGHMPPPPRDYGYRRHRRPYHGGCLTWVLGVIAMIALVFGFLF